MQLSSTSLHSGFLPDGHNVCVTCALCGWMYRFSSILAIQEHFNEVHKGSTPAIKAEQERLTRQVLDHEWSLTGGTTSSLAMPSPGEAIPFALTDTNQEVDERTGRLWHMWMLESQLRRIQEELSTRDQADVNREALEGQMKVILATIAQSERLARLAQARAQAQAGQ